MNQLNRISFIIVTLAAMLFFTACSDQFLKDKQDYNAYGTEIYNDITGATERVNYLYYLMLPSSTSGLSYCMPSAGTNDICSASTEEHGSLIYTDATSPSNWLNPTIILDNTNVPDYFYYQNKNISPYGYIRECNNVIEGVKAGTLTESQKEQLLGQAYFFRAWMYLHLVKIYGGVPIIDHVQNPMIGSSGGENLIVPRSTSKACIDFICSDLELAAKYLPLSWGTSSTGRITAGAALAVAGRARLLYASPIHNRADNADRWELAYQMNKAALDTLQLGGFGLAYASAPGTNGSNWAKMFSDYNSSEAVFVTLYNNLLPTGSGTTYYKNNQWENGIRPINSGGGGGKSTTAQMVDLFPMADGKPSSDYLSSTNTTRTVSNLLSASSYTYDALRFIANRDPRFYRTFAFPGERWAYTGDTVSISLTYPYRGTSYKLWNYTWYADATNQASDNVTGFAADGLGTNNTSVYVRKRSDDYDVNTSPLYTYSSILGANKNFLASAAPYMEIRYAEVLLNFAEAACGAKHYDEAVAALQQIRARVGYTSANNYGLDADLSSNRAKLFAAILYERQIEFAFEGKRFDDMRRWMLFDGGTGTVTGQPATWTLTGFGGNTCTYLGVLPFNGMRRTGIEMTVSPNNTTIGTAYLSTMATTTGFANDPIIKKSIKRSPVAGLNLMSNVTTWPSSTGTTPMDSLCYFYGNYLQRKTTRVDGTPTTYTIQFQPQYYFIGLRTSAQQMNVTLLQTIGWADYEKGGANGTFDPIAE